MKTHIMLLIFYLFLVLVIPKINATKILLRKYILWDIPESKTRLLSDELLKQYNFSILWRDKETNYLDYIGDNYRRFLWNFQK